jgi:hypothetical protein
MKEGKQIYEFLERSIRMELIGLMPMNMNDGYLLLRDSESDTQVYTYSITLFEEAGAAYRGIHTSYVMNVSSSIMNTYEHIKNMLIDRFPSFPNPAVYAAETSLYVPRAETFLPIAKRMLVRQVAHLNR